MFRLLLLKSYYFKKGFGLVTLSPELSDPESVVLWVFLSWYSLCSEGHILYILVGENGVGRDFFCFTAK